MEKEKGRVCVFCKNVIEPDDELGMYKFIKDGVLVDAHKKCHQRDRADKSNIRIKVF